MKKNLLRVSLLALTMVLATTVCANKYVIYPIPQQMTMHEETLPMTAKVNIVSETTIDQATRNRAKNVLEAAGFEVISEGTDAAHVTLRLGTVGSNGAVEALAFGELGMDETSLMATNKFDRHAVSISAQGITVIGENTNAVFYGLASLEQMLEQQDEGTLRYTLIYDYADQQNRGLVEGYYGYPYSVDVKKDLMHYMMRHKMNTYMYGAKSDPYHSQMWKQAYPETITAEQEKNGWLTQEMVSEIAKVSEETKVNFIWAIHPGNEFLGSATVIEDIMSKFELMYNLGVRHFGVFVDDVGIPSSDEDMKKNADRLTQLQGAIEKKWNVDAAEATDTVRPLHFVPQIYCNGFASSEDQRKRFMAALSKVPQHITVYSTGQGVWSVPNNNHTSTVVNEFGRPMGWWWNYPCNDNADGQIYPMDMYSNFVDMPAVGDNETMPTVLANCQGLVANPMQQGEIAKIPLFSVADYSWNNADFKNTESWEASFKSLIEDEQVRQAFRDIATYLRWNDPQSMQTLIETYKNSLENGTPDAIAIMDAILKIKSDCEKVITLKDSEIQSDRLLYTDLSPWLHTLHTYSIVVEKMLGILNNPSAHQANWLAVKEVSDSLAALEHSTLYTAYALEGMGNGISVSKRQAQLSRRYLHPFVYLLKEKTIDPYFDDPTAITAPMVINNSPLLDAKVNVTGATLSLSMETRDLDMNKYVGVALPAPVLIDKLTIDESLIPLARYSSDGKRWMPIAAETDVVGKHVGYFIFINETDKGIKGFVLNEGSFSLTTAAQAIPVSVTIPNAGIYDNHTAAMMTDGNYNTYTCLNRNQASGDCYVLDLGGEVVLNDIRLCMGTVNSDYPIGAKIEYSTDGNSWNSLKVLGATTTDWSINLSQNVKYSDEMVYCDFDGEKKEARYVRLRLSNPNTSKWMRLYEMEVNRQHGANSTQPQCSDGNGALIDELTDAHATTGMHEATASPLTYAFNRMYDVEGVTIYSLPSTAQPTISVTTDNNEWTGIGTLSETCQRIDLKEYPQARAIRLEWQGVAPAIYEIMPEYDMETSSLSHEDSELADAFAWLKSQAIQALDSCGQGDKLITSNSQFSSPYTESSEGSINNLLDGNQSSFWHSAWSGSAVADGVHYIEVALPEGTMGDILMHFGRRSNTDGHHLTKARIEGVVSGSGESAVTEKVTELEMPFKDKTETVVKKFNLSKAYSSIRLVELSTTGGSGFFHIGELQFYTMLPCYIAEDAFDEADALIEAMRPMPSEATLEDLDKLQEAYEAFMLRVFDIEYGEAYYPIVFDKGLNYTHASRRLNSISLHGSADGNKTIAMPDPSKIYNKVDAPCFTAMPGEKVTPVFNFTGTWMNGFVYLDCGHDGAFDAALNSDGSIPEASDIMAFSYSEPVIGSGVGYNSTGAKVTNADVLNPPAFTIPDTLAPGFYLMRYKVDWVSIDPAGRPEDGNGIIKNGGAICDVRINIHTPEGSLTVISDKGTLLAADGSALPATVPFGKALGIKVIPEEGYILDALIIRHGHGLGGEVRKCGVKQYEETLITAAWAEDGIITIPAEYIDGEVEIEASYATEPTVTGGDGYALSFDKDATSTLSYEATINLAARPYEYDFAVEGNRVYTDCTDSPLALLAPKSVSISVDDNRDNLHYYLYIDLNNDGKFTALLNTEGTPAYSSELVSFTCHDGKDSKGNSVATPSKALPRYTLPANLPAGIYRARLKGDTNNTDPAGSADMLTNGGVVIDFLINIVPEKCTLELKTVNGSIIGSGNTALPIEVTPMNEIQFKLLAGAPGYVADKVVVRHGHHLDGEQYIHGNKQWSEDVIDTSNRLLTLPSEYVNGEVQMFAEFVRSDDSAWHLVFSDEFDDADGTQPDSQWWSRCTRMNATWNRWLSDSEEVIYMEDGKLVARAIPNPDTSKDNVPMITGGIWSRNKFGFTYGRIEGRIKSNPWKGNFPAFWMMPEDQSGGWPNDGEIDIWETIDAQERAWHTVHSNWTYNLGKTNEPRSSFNEYTAHDRYHIYTLEWNETSLVWYVDGKQVAQYNKASSQDALNKGQWPYNDHFHIILNQSVGNGSWAANADVTHTYVTLFDWVRVYQKNGMKNTLGTVGIEPAEENRPTMVTAVDGGIAVSVGTPQSIAVFDPMGRKVAEAYVESSHTFRLSAGIYIIEGAKVIVE